VENSLVAALGFEPTTGAGDDGTAVLVDDGSGDGLDWSTGEADNGSDERNGELHAESELADGFGAADSASPTTAEVADAMTPPKGKGKGPRTYRRSSRARPTAKPPPMPDPSAALDPSSADNAAEYTDDATLTIGRGTTSSAGSPAAAAAVAGNGQTDLDPADLVDSDPAAGREPLTDQELASLAPPEATDEFVGPSDATSPIPAGLFNGTGSDAGAFSNDPPPPTIDEPLDSAQAAPETLVVDGLSLDVAPPPPPPPADESLGLFDDDPPPAAKTVVSDAPPTLPPVVVPSSAPPTVVPVAEASPITEAPPATSPPPPVIGDPDPLAVPGTNGAGAAAAAAGVTVAARAEATSRGGDRGVKVPQLLDQGLLKRTRRVRARKVRRVVRHIDPWSVLTFSVLFFLCLFAALLLASVLVWNAAVAAGTIENIESFIRDIGDYQTYEINGDVVFRAAMVIAGILTLAASVMLVLLVVVFNLISDLVGGIRVTVVEEETIRVRRRNQ